VRCIELETWNLKLETDFRYPVARRSSAVTPPQRWSGFVSCRHRSRHRFESAGIVISMTFFGPLRRPRMSANRKRLFSNPLRAGSIIVPSDGTLLAILPRNRIPSRYAWKGCRMVANVVMLVIASGVLIVPVLWVLRPVRTVTPY
jgi:hypothetical protein